MALIKLCLRILLSVHIAVGQQSPNKRVLTKNRMDVIKQGSNIRAQQNIKIGKVTYATCGKHALQRKGHT